MKLVLATRHGSQVSVYSYSWDLVYLAYVLSVLNSNAYVVHVRLYHAIENNQKIILLC